MKKILAWILTSALILNAPFSFASDETSLRGVSLPVIEALHSLYFFPERILPRNTESLIQTISYEDHIKTLRFFYEKSGGKRQFDEFQDFYIESRFLLRLIKAGRFNIVESQFHQWLFILNKFAFPPSLNKQKNKSWENQILTTFIAALEDEGPWTSPEMERIGSYLASRPELQDSAWALNAKDALNSEESANAIKRLFNYAGAFSTSLCVTAFSLTVYTLLTTNASISLFSGGPFSYLVPALFTTSAMNLYLYGVVKKNAAFFSPLKSRISYPHKKIRTFCSDLLKGQEENKKP